MRHVVCLLCWKEFDCKTNAKYCSKECSEEAHKLKKREAEKKHYVRQHICKRCWNLFQTRQWRNEYCDECKKDIAICPNCWWPKDKRWRYKFCNKCKALSHKYNCIICWKECLWMHNTLYCSECFPKCKVCWQPVKTSHNWCCSISCATKYKWNVTSRDVLEKHLNDIFIWKYNWWNKSSVNDKRELFFINNGIEYEREFRLENNIEWFDRLYIYFDFKIWNYLIDINPTFSHNSTYPYRKWAKILDKKYHFYKTSLWESLWYNVINLFDRDNNDKVKAWLLWLIKWRKRLYWSEIKNVDICTAKEFCEKNHLQWYCPATIWQWLYSKWKLINIMWWTYYPSKNEWDLVRFASEQWYYIAHWAEKLFKHFIKTYNPNYIISFSDRTKHSWNLYRCLWMEESIVDEPWYRWVYTKTNTPYFRTSCKKSSMHLLPWFEWVEKYDPNNITPFWKNTEEKLMETHWYVIVYNCWNRRHVRHNPSCNSN